MRHIIRKPKTGGKPQRYTKTGIPVNRNGKPIRGDGWFKDAHSREITQAIKKQY